MASICGAVTTRRFALNYESLWPNDSVTSSRVNEGDRFVRRSRTDLEDVRCDRVSRMRWGRLCIDFHRLGGAHSLRNRVALRRRQAGVNPSDSAVKLAYRRNRTPLIDFNSQSLVEIAGAAQNVGILPSITGPLKYERTRAVYASELRCFEPGAIG